LAIKIVRRWAPARLARRGRTARPTRSAGGRRDYSSGRPVTAATLDYLEQFATYDPPGGQGPSVPVIADYSGLTAAG